jgi:hypothetical protein
MPSVKTTHGCSRHRINRHKIQIRCITVGRSLVLTLDIEIVVLVVAILEVVLLVIIEF